MSNKELICLNIDKEKILISTFIGKNRSLEIHEWHQKVFDYFNLPINYIYIPFEIGYPYGRAIDDYVNSLLDHVDYFVFMDVDAIPLKNDSIKTIINFIKNKETIWGLSQQSTHILKNGIPNHPYAGFSSCAFSKDLYIKLGKPTFSETPRGDIGEELTWRCEELGYNICLSYPTEFHELTEEEMSNTGNTKHGWVNNGIKLGLGTTFGNGLCYHSFHTSCLPGTNQLAIPRAAELFIKKAKGAIGKNRKLELITGCVNSDRVKYSKYLEITLKENKDLFDNILIVTTPEDLETQKICKENGVDFFCTNEFFANGSKFDNNKAFSAALHKLKYKDWIVGTSPDIIFPKDFREKFKLENLDIETMYGTSRVFLPHYQDWIDLKNGKKTINDFESIPGWGCGFCQIFSLNSPKLKDIPLTEVFPSNGCLLESDIWTLRRFHPDVKTVGKLDINLIHLGDKDFGGQIRDNLTSIKGFFGE
jgi:hypothetical protein